MAASYAELSLMAWSKIVGFDVSPVTENSSLYCLSVPVSSRSRVMLSSQMLWPRLWSNCVAFIVSPSWRGSRSMPFRAGPCLQSIRFGRMNRSEHRFNFFAHELEAGFSSHTLPNKRIDPHRWAGYRGHSGTLFLRGLFFYK